MKTQRSSTEYSKNKAEFILEKLMEAYKVVFVKVDGETEEFEICNLEYEIENTEEDECGQPLALAMAK
nr:YopT family protein [Bacillus licheniformis]